MKDGIYIYQCLGDKGCAGLLMMHQQNCPNCGVKNDFYDSSIHIKEDVERGLNLKLKTLSNINMKTKKKP